MNFEDFVKAWQCQRPPAKATLDPEALLKTIRTEQFVTKWGYLFTDLFIVGVDAMLVPFFLYFGNRFDAWSSYLMAFVCFFIGVFILVDRWRQRRRQSVSENDTLVSCTRSLLAQMKHETWRSKNIFWWYVLPLEIGFFATGLSMIQRAVSRPGDWVEVLLGLLGWVVWVLFCGGLGWFICWSSKRTREKITEPRRKELEELLANLTENPSTAGPGLPPEEISKMKTRFFIVIVVFILVFGGVFAFIVRNSVKTVKTVSTLRPSPATDLETIQRKHGVPALAVVVTKDGLIRDRAAAGVRKFDDPTLVTTNDVFHIGSCTKSMTATLAALLIEQGKLRWDTTIAEVFPELKGKMDQQYETVTMEQLLHHRGGVSGSPPPAAWARAWQEIGTPREQRREFIEAVLQEPPAAKPGENEIYSNQGYAIAGAMLETISGQDFESLMTEKLFKPLRMDTAGFGAPGAQDKVDQPWGHTRRQFATVPEHYDNPPAISPAGRVHCSLDDLARYAMLHLQENATDGLLKPETLARLHKPDNRNTSSPVENYACGWAILERGWAGGRTLWHNGSNTMWYIVMWLAPEKNFCVIAVTNVAGSDAVQACDDACVMMIHKWLTEK